jgi:hypothetical protein
VLAFCAWLPVPENEPYLLPKLKGVRKEISLSFQLVDFKVLLHERR